MLFRSEREIAQWRRQQGRQGGAALSLAQVWQLAQLWYSDRLAANFRGRSLAEAQGIFRRLGLSGDFWRGPTRASENEKKKERL